MGSSSIGRYRTLASMFISPIAMAMNDTDISSAIAQRIVIKFLNRILTPDESWIKTFQYGVAFAK